MQRNTHTHTHTHRAYVERCIKQQSKGLSVKKKKWSRILLSATPTKKTLFPQASSCPLRRKTVTSHQQLLNDMSLHLIFYSHPLHMFRIQQWCVQCWVPFVNCELCVTVKKNYSAANPTRSQRAANKRIVVVSRLAPAVGGGRRQWRWAFQDLDLGYLHFTSGRQG